jgi:hypothetical protein
MLFPLKASNIDIYEEKEKFTLIQINAKWNTKNDVEIPQIPNCNIQYAFLEDQKESFKKNINYVPVVVLYKGNHPIQQWSADISFKLKINEKDILDAIKRVSK